MIAFRRILRRRRRGNSILIILLVLVVAIIIFSLIYRHLITNVENMATAEARNSVSLAVNSAVAKKMATGAFAYSDLVTLITDSDGKISAITTNIVKINALKSELADEIIENITLGNIATMSIPAGNLIGNILTSGRGYNIPVRVVLANSIEERFRNSFSSAGINQTLHRIWLEVDITVNILVPGKTSQIVVSTEMVVAETVIVGSVPDSYTYFESSEQYDEPLEYYDVLS